MYNDAEAGMRMAPQPRGRPVDGRPDILLVLADTRATILDAYRRRGLDVPREPVVVADG
jgi:hypothetical protein